MRSKYFVFIALVLACVLQVVPAQAATTTTNQHIPPQVLKVLQNIGTQTDPDAPATTDSSTSTSTQPTPDQAAIVPDEYYHARVTEIVKQGTENVGGLDQPYQQLRVLILDGPDAGRTVEFTHGGDSTIRDDQRVKTGEEVVLIKQHQLDGSISYGIVDSYRLPGLVIVVALFLALTVFFGRIRGLGAIVGLALSVLILAKFVVPKIIAGASPLGICLLGAVMIAIISMYLAHGFSRRTTVALVSTLVTLGFATGVAFLFVWLTKLTGVGSEDAFYLTAGPTQNLNFQGLLLGAILIGALGVLEDITIGQAAAVDEIHQANPSLKFADLARRGLSVGREHIAALVNTLALAYAGASFPLFLLFYVYQTQPAWVTLNSQLIVEEVVRTLVGSSALVLAVPLTTLLTAYLWTKRKSRKNDASMAST